MEPVFKRWYGEKAFSLWEIAQELPQNHRSIVLDPSVISHLDEFMNFYRKKKFSDQTEPWEIRKKFSETSKKITVWRGVNYTDPKVAEQQRNEGIRPGLLRPGAWPENEKRVTLKNLLAPQSKSKAGWLGPTGIFDSIRGHHEGMTEGTPLVSVSPYIEVAHMGAWDRMLRKYYPGKFHLFKIEMPEVDFIRFEGNFAVVKSWWEAGGNPDYVTRTLDGKGEYKHKFTDVDHEYLTDQIPPEAIKEIFPYNSLPPSWNWSMNPKP